MTDPQPPAEGTYSTTEEMLLEQVEIARGENLQKYVQAAADEIHMKLGFVYKTPIAAPTGKELPLPVSLLLKRISVDISTGLALRATIGASTQGDRINAYAATLLAEGRTALDAIASDRMVLEGAERLPDQAEASHGPRIVNADSFSQVDAFYSQFTGGTQDMLQPSPFSWLRGFDPHAG